MPDALIVYDDTHPMHQDNVSVVEKMVKIGLIKRVVVGGVQVYGRHYLTNRAIREAYKRKTKGVEQFKKHINQ